MLPTRGYAMTRILLGECKQEVSSFNPALSHYDDFTFSRGNELIAVHQSAQSEMGGALSVFAARDDARWLACPSGK